VTDLVNHDTQVGADMSNATAGEGKIIFTDYTTGDGKKIPSPPQNPTVIDQSQSLPVPDGRHPCDAWEITKRVSEAVGGTALIGGTLAAGIPTGPPGWAVAAGTIGTAGAGVIDGFQGLEQCEP
jgi:hypothetical protein